MGSCLLFACKIKSTQLQASKKVRIGRASGPAAAASDADATASDANAMAASDADAAAVSDADAAGNVMIQYRTRPYKLSSSLLFALMVSCSAFDLDQWSLKMCH